MASDPSTSAGPLRLLHDVLFRLHGLALRYPRTTLLASLLVVAGLACQIPRMKILLSLTDLVEEGLPSTARNRGLKEAFEVGNSVGVILAPETDEGAFTAKEIGRIRSWIARQDSGNGALLRTLSPFDLQRRVRRGWRSRPAPLLERGTPGELRGLVDTPWGGILTDRAGRDIGIDFAFRDAPGGSRYGSFDPAVVGLLAKDCAAELGGGGRVKAYFTGPAAFQYYALEGIKRFRFLNLLVLVVILVVFRVLFGTWRSGALLIGLLLFTGIVVYGAMSLAGAPIDFLSTGLFLILSVAALEDYLFLSYEQLARRTDWRGLFSGMLVPGFLTSLTTVIGFGSLCVSDLAIIRRFGFWAAFGASVEWVVTFLVLPPFLSLVRPCRTWTDPGRAWEVALPARLVRLSLPRRVAVLLLAVHALGAAGALRMESSDSVASLFPAAHPYRQGLEYVARSRDWIADISVVFPEARRRTANERALATLAAHPNVARVLDPYAIVDFVSGGRPEGYLERLEQGLGPTGKLRALFSEGGRTRAILYLKGISLKEMNATVRFVEEACRAVRCYPAGDLVSYAEFASKVPSVLFESFGASLLLVGLVLAGLLLLTGHGRLLPVLAASFWGPAFMMAALWILRVPLNYLTCVFASVLVGLAGDNTIQFLLARTEGSLASGMGRRGGASIQVALVMGLACLIFLGSSFVPSQRLGLLLAAGFAVSIVGDIWILKGLLERPRRGPQEVSCRPPA